MGLSICVKIFNGSHSGGSSIVNVNDCWLLQKLFVYHRYKVSFKKKKKKKKKSQYMVSHPETGSDSPIGSNRDRGRDIHALLKLELNNICLLDTYLCVFQAYYYHIYGKIGTDTMYLNMFYSKIPDPWGSALIRDYRFVNSNTLERRISFLKETLSELCHQAYLIKKAKTIRKDNVLCCKGNDLITVIEDLKRTYQYKKNKPYKRFYKRYDRKRYFFKRRPRYFKNNWNTRQRTNYRKKKSSKGKRMQVLCLQPNWTL